MIVLDSILPRSFPASLSHIKEGIASSAFTGIPEGWETFHHGSMGAPHGYLFPKEVEKDLALGQGLIMTAFPLSDLSTDYENHNVIVLPETNQASGIVEGFKDGKTFQLQGVNLQAYRQKRRLPGTPRGFSHISLSGNGLTVLYCRLDDGDFEWDQDIFENIAFTSWSSLILSKSRIKNLISQSPPLSPMQKEGMVSLGRSRVDQNLSQGQGVLHSQTLVGVAERTLTSSMQGHSRISGAGMHVEFLRGRFHNLTWGSNPLESAGPAESFLVFKGKKIPYVSISSFSLEGEGIWGIRETLLCESPFFRSPGRMVVDYFFADGIEDLTVSLSVRWPVFFEQGTVSSWATWLLPVGKFGMWHKPTVEHWMEGKWTSLPAVKSALIRTQAVRVSNQGKGLTLRFYQGLGQRPHNLPLLYKDGTLFLNPEGGFTEQPVSEFDGREEHMHWGLTLSDQGFAHWPKEPLSELLPPMIATPKKVAD